MGGELSTKLQSFTRGSTLQRRMFELTENLQKSLFCRRDESLDSGISSATEQQKSQKYSNAMLSRQPRQRSRHFEMVPAGRHKFEIRDLREMIVDDDAIVVPLELPKLPTQRAEIVTGGLCRSSNISSSITTTATTTDNDTQSDMSMSTSSSTRPASLISTATEEEEESCEEEKISMDTSRSEKSQQQKSAGEALISSMDCSSITSSRQQQETYTVEKNAARTDDEDDLSEMTITADHTSYLDSVTLRSSSTADNKSVVNDAFMRQPKTASITRKELFFGFKFSDTVTKARNSANLDDETSPTDSLVSSSESGEGILSRPEKQQDDGGDICKKKYDEVDLEDISPIDDFPSPSTPTHASNSLSLSDGNRDDFLIDDEIADQPELVFDEDKKHKSNISNSINQNLASATSTLREISMTSHLESDYRSLTNNNTKSHKFQPSPASNRRQLQQTMERSGSLDTLSPCDSIASDDLMADFEINSSLDSIDR